MIRSMTIQIDYAECINLFGSDENKYVEYVNLFGSTRNYYKLRFVSQPWENQHFIEHFGIKYLFYDDKFMFFTVIDEKKFTFACLKHGISFKIFDDRKCS
jgi:hypothetical protein